MVATTIDWVVGAVVLIVGLFILYKPLKEPLDLFFGFIGSLFRRAIDWLNGTTNYTGTEVIRYG